MPIYEYYCPDNDTIYSFWSPTSAMASKPPRCPANRAFRMERHLSAFAVMTPRKSAGDPALEGDAPDDPRVEAAMAELEREMAGLDDEDPDPRRLGHLMRRMSGLMGERMPPEVDEMIARMEKGEDPEKLEEEYGEALDQAFGGEEEGVADGTEDAASGEESPGSGPVPGWRNLLRRRGPKRDPDLYDIREWRAP